MPLFEIYHGTRKTLTRFQNTVLERVVGIGSLFSSGYGDVGSSIYFALGVTTIYAGGASFLAILVAGLFFLATALCYAELTSAYPQAGGSSLFAQKAFGDGWSFFSGWALLLDYVITLSISAFSVGPYLGYFFPVLKNNTQANVTFTGILILVLILLNVVGLKESSWMSLLLAGFDILTQVSLMAFGFFFLFDFKKIWGQFTMGTNPTWPHFLYGISVAMVAYIGIEAISQQASEAKDPTRTIPRAMFLTVITTLFLYSGIGLVALSAMDPKILSTTWVNDPIAGIAHYIPHFGAYLSPWVAILGATILSVAANAGLIGASRLAYSMSNNYLIHPIFRHTSKRFRTPVIAIVSFGCLSGVIMAFFPYLDILADLYNYGAMIAYFMTNFALIALRNKLPDLPRPYRVPFSIKIRKWEIPLPAVIGMIGTGGVFALVLIYHKYGRVLGTLWMIGGILYYVWFRKQERLPLMEEVRITEIPEPEEDRAMAHQHFLVATSPDRPTPVLRDILKVARADQARVTVVTILEVPLALPLDAALPEEETLARHTLSLCQAIGLEEEIFIDTNLIRSREIGSALMEEYKRQQADTLVINQTDSPVSALIQSAVSHSGLSVNLWTFRQSKRSLQSARLIAHQPVTVPS